MQGRAGPMGRLAAAARDQSTEPKRASALDVVCCPSLVTAWHVSYRARGVAIAVWGHRWPAAPTSATSRKSKASASLDSPFQATPSRAHAHADASLHMRTRTCRQVRPRLSRLRLLLRRRLLLLRMRRSFHASLATALALMHALIRTCTEKGSRAKRTTRSHPRTLTLALPLAQTARAGCAGPILRRLQRDGPLRQAAPPRLAATHAHGAGAGAGGGLAVGDGFGARLAGDTAARSGRLHDHQR